MRIDFPSRLALYSAKIVSKLLKIKGYGGSTLPGYIIERFAPRSIGPILELLPECVIVVCGTNGKTTTTKMIADLLRAHGKSVFTNAAGSNFTRGIVAEVAASVSWRGTRLPHDYAVLELDEAYGVDFVRYVKPAHVVVLNVLRDQLDRFGEIDQTAQLLMGIMKHAQVSCVVNGNETTLVDMSETLTVPVSYYAVNNSLRWLFPTDDELLQIEPNEAAREQLPVAVELLSIKNQTVTYGIAGKTYTTDFALRGVYNYQNAAAVLTLLGRLLPDITTNAWLTELSSIKPAFGRGEVITIDNRQLEIILVKNPSGFQQALCSYNDDAAVLMAINDNYADGRDISWLWDVDFSILDHKKVSIVSGRRAYDMALRLQYDNIECDAVFEDISTGLAQLLMQTEQNMRIFCNYTAMLQIRAELSKQVPMERVI